MPHAWGLLAGPLVVFGVIGQAGSAASTTKHVPFYAGYDPNGRQCPNTDKTIRTPNSATEIVELVKAASSNKQTVSVGGGRNTAWWDAGDVPISMENMTQVLDVDKEKLTMTVQTGLTAGQIQEAANKEGMMAAIGQSAKVGVGFLLQGGFGHQTRMMGLGSDRVVGAEAVTADGKHVCVGDQPKSDPNSPECERLSPQDDADLLYAIRGAGPNFAVVLSLTVSMVPLHVCDCNFQEFALGSDPTGASAYIFQPYAAYARTAPRNLNVDGIIFYSVTANDWVLGVYNHFFKPEGADWAPPPALSIPEHQPVKGPEVTSDVKPYMLPEIEPSGKITPPELGIDFGRGATWIGLGCYVDTAQDLTNVWEVLAGAMMECPNKFCYTLLQHAGGAISDTPINATAFGASRGIEWMLYVVGVGYQEAWENDTSHVNNVNQWVKVTFRKLLAQSSGTYATDLSPEDNEFIPYSYGTNMGKICQLKVPFDPEGMFTAGSVPLAYWCNYQFGGIMLRPKGQSAEQVGGVVQKDAMPSQLEMPRPQVLSGLWSDTGFLLLMGVLTAITVASSTVSVLSFRAVRLAIRRSEGVTEPQEQLLISRDPVAVPLHG